LLGAEGTIHAEGWELPEGQEGTVDAEHTEGKGGAHHAEGGEGGVGTKGSEGGEGGLPPIFYLQYTILLLFPLFKCVGATHIVYRRADL